MKLKLVWWIMVLMLSLQFVAALGIRPAQTKISYEETPVMQGSFWVVNNDHQSMEVVISTSGPLSKYVQVKPEQVTLNPDEDFKEIEFTVELPDDLPPGDTLSYITVEQLLSSTEENFITSKLVLRHKIVVTGIYPDKYVVADVNFHDQGESIALVAELKNLGQKDIGTVQTTFYVNDREQQQHALETETTSLKSKETKLLRSQLDKDLLEYGEFEVSAITKYDDQKIELVKILRVGQPDVQVTYFDTYFIANQINPYTIDLLNKWNRELKSVFIDVQVKKNDVKIDEFKTKSVDLPGELVQRITDYFNAEGQDPGKYTFDLVVNFWNVVRMDQKEFEFEAELLSEKDSESIDRKTPVVGQAASPGETSSSSVLPWVIIGMLLGIMGVYVLYRYMHRDDYEGGNRGAL